MLTAVKSPCTASIYSVLFMVDEVVQKGDTVIVVESMKVLIDVLAPCSGIIKKILVQEGQVIDEGTTLMEIAT